MISRTIAETGVRDLFKIVHALTLKHSTRAEKVRLRNKWVSVNPREWARRTDLSISVGLGSAGPQQQMQNLMVLGQAQEKAQMMGLVQPTNVYNLLKKIVTAAGFKSPEEFFSEPKKQPKMGQDGQPVMGPNGEPEMEDAPPPQPKDPAVQVAEIKAQSDQAKVQAEGQTKGMELQMQSAADRERMQNEMQVQASNDARELQIAKYKIDREQETEVLKAQLAAETALKVAQIKADADRESAALQSETEQNKAYIGVEGEREKAKIQSEGKVNETKAKINGPDLSPVLDRLEKIAQEMGGDREIVRGKDGRATGVRRVRNGA
jgi:hypothetical protein